MTNLKIQYEDRIRQIEKAYNISTRRIYLSMNMIYLFDVNRFRVGKEALTPKIYNPRFL